MARKRRIPYTNICKFCHKEFKLSTHYKIKKFCSHRCYSNSLIGTKQNETTKEKRKLKLIGQPRIGYIPSKNIGDLMRGKKWSEKRRIDFANSRRGNKTNFWKGGISRTYKTGYYSSQYKKWRRDVFSRDKFICRSCGEKTIYITAHHIKSFAHYPTLRFDIKNGLTLCEECHKMTDNYKGRKQRLCVQGSV